MRKLLEPLKVGNMELRNRVILSAMAKYFCTNGFIGQEYINGAIFLDQHLAHQHFQCILHLCLQRTTIIVNAGNHQADDVVHVGFDLQNIFN